MIDKYFCSVFLVVCVEGNKVLKGLVLECYYATYHFHPALKLFEVVRGLKHKIEKSKFSYESLNVFAATSWKTFEGERQRKKFCTWIIPPPKNLVVS